MIEVKSEQSAVTAWWSEPNTCYSVETPRGSFKLDDNRQQTDPSEAVEAVFSMIPEISTEIFEELRKIVPSILHKMDLHKHHLTVDLCGYPRYQLAISGREPIQTSDYLDVIAAFPDLPETDGSGAYSRRPSSRFAP